MEGNNKKIIVVGGVSDKSMWMASNGKATIREQDFVILGGRFVNGNPIYICKTPF